ncbi:hypothetical protein [Mesorhizobium silamurunense]|uniref:hypothetical protein n=1 Tax=Mesorhizobium silamurunense TaxID=499528 RepID=UPI0028A5D5C1|nr:hypothetical protein [Mesorhizobium silamurunense]
MPTSHDLSGLMKFLARDEWRECFEEVFNEHFGSILDEGEREFEHLAEVLGDHWTNTLWGCVFEDFLTQKISRANLPTSSTNISSAEAGRKERNQGPTWRRCALPS